MGIHLGNNHGADLGDGDDKKEHHFLARQYYFPLMGACWEGFTGAQRRITWTGTDSPAGGHHFQQNGTLSNSGAWFIGYVLRVPNLKLGWHSASKGESTAKKHIIVPNGDNLGRDWLVEKATTRSYWKDIWREVDVEWSQGLLEPGNDGEQARPYSPGWSHTTVV